MIMYKLTHGGSYCWLSLSLSLMLIFLCVVFISYSSFSYLFIFLLYFVIFCFFTPISWFYTPITHKDRSVSSLSAVNRLQQFKMNFTLFPGLFFFSC
ncbi:hypothetical protein GDO78_002489 [Eleutherodactylus coqui]|uniref:Uncharacterized protein n=1 Tax=Eleutherodactylus coqui TaxID=57060 RepID=A0A8J6EY17_ELECQ|nr:hypothetical protein GDO78_002489 [Eleutherodactylus coqui]